MSELKKLSLEDLKIGMIVKKSQLEDIVGITIYFDHYDFEQGGKIIYIGKGGTKESREIVKRNGGIISTFYQNPDDIEDEVIICE